MSVTAFAFPDVEGSTPVTVTADAPVLNIFKPVTEAALADAFGNPVNGVVILDKVILNGGHLDEPGFSCVIDEGGVASPAEGIIVLELGCGEEFSVFIEVDEDIDIGILDELACVGSFLGHIALAVNELNEGEVVFSADLCVILTECGSDMNDARTVGHCNVIVNGDIVTLLILLCGACACAFKERLVFSVFKVCALICFKDFVSFNAVFLVAELTENGIKQSLSHIVGVAVCSLNLAVGFLGVNAQSNV